MGFRKYARKQIKRGYRFVRNRYAKGGVGQAMKDIAMLKSVVNVERKFVDSTVLYSDGATELDWNGAILLTTGVGQGAAENQRNGNSIKATGIDTMIDMRGTTSAANGVTKLRCILFIDTENQDTNPAVTDVLESTYVGTSTVCSSMKNDLTRKRFRILHDRTYTLDQNNVLARTIRVYKKLHHHIKYSGANSTDQREGQVYWLFISDQDPASAGSTPTVRPVSRFRYIDN